jgi:hypothetical protein
MGVQAQGYCGRPMKYKGMWDVLQQTVRKEGVRGLYKARASSLDWPPCFWAPMHILVHGQMILLCRARVAGTVHVSSQGSSDRDSLLHVGHPAKFGQGGAIRGHQLVRV